MEMLAVVLLGVALLALVIALEAGVFSVPRRRRRIERLHDPRELDEQCVATTADGRRCIRVKTSRHQRYCWQHQRMAQRVPETGGPITL